jgi:ABC-type nitrate/sulfonate/bicarbonate transport system permease component
MATADLGRAAQARPITPWRNPLLGVRLLTLAAVWAVWELLAHSGLFYKDVVPSSLAVMEEVLRHLASAAFYGHLATTAIEVAVGFAIAVIAGIGLGILFGARPFAGKVAEPFVQYLAPAPKIIFLPILMILFGIHEGSKIAMGTISAFFPIVISTTAGMLTIEPVLIRVGRNFGASTWQMVWKIYLPALLVPIISGLRLGLGVAIIGVLLGEVKLSNRGLGFLAIQHYNTFQIADMYAVLIIIFALAVAANEAMSRLTPRHARSTSGQS